MFCSQCGEKNSDQAVVCYKCGHVFNRLNNAQNPVTIPDKNPTQFAHETSAQ